MKRGNGANCTAKGADVSQYMAKAKARAALAKGLAPSTTPSTAPTSVSAKSTLGSTDSSKPSEPQAQEYSLIMPCHQPRTPIKSPDMKKIRTATEGAVTKRVSTKGKPPVPEAAKEPDSCKTAESCLSCN